MLGKRDASIVAAERSAELSLSFHRNNSATWRIVFIYPRFYILSPLFDDAGLTDDFTSPSDTPDRVIQLLSSGRVSGTVQALERRMSRALGVLKPMGTT